MGSPTSPFHRDHQNQIPNALLDDWLAEGLSDRHSNVARMSSDIASCYEPFRLDEAAKLVRSLGRLETLSEEGRPSQHCAFISVGGSDSLEVALAYVLAASLGLPVILDAFLDLHRSSERQISISTAKRDSQSVEFGPVLLDPFVQIDLPDSPRGRLTEAIKLSGTRDPVWIAVSLFAQVPEVESAILVIDIKVGDSSPALAYQEAFEIGKAVLKLAALMGVSCRIMLSDAAVTDSLAFGQQVRLLSFASALKGSPEPFTVVSTHMVVEAMIAGNPNLSRDSANVGISDAFSSERLVTTARNWNMPQLAPWLEDAPTHSVLEGAALLTVRTLGYLRHVDGSRIWLAMHEVTDQIIAAQLSAFVRIQARLGQELSMNDGLALVGGFPGGEIPAQLINAIYSACQIGDEKPHSNAPIRVSMLPESALVRRQVALVIPVVKNGHETRVFVPSESAGRSPYIVYFDSSSFFSSTDEIARVIARKTVPLSVEYSVSRIGTLTSRRVVYEPATNNVLSPRFALFAVLIGGVNDTNIVDARTGRWLDLVQLNALDIAELPNDLRDDWEQISHLLQAAVG